MEGTVKCASCGSDRTDVGEGTIFCCGCNAALGVIKGKVMEFDMKMVEVDAVLKRVFAQKGDPKEVAEEFAGNHLNREIAMNAMDLQATVVRMTAALERIANSEDCGGNCNPLHDIARKALRGE